MPGNSIQVDTPTGGIRIKNDGIVIAGVSDACCCVPDPGVCMVGFIGSWQCDAATGQITGWSVNYGGPPIVSYGVWVEIATEPPRYCPAYGTYVQYTCGDPVPSPPSPPSMRSYPCTQCFDITVSVSNWYKFWINGVLCDENELAFGPNTVRVSFGLCGNKLGPVDGFVVSGDEGSDWVGNYLYFKYDATTDTVSFTTRWGRSSSYPYVVDATCPDKPYNCTVEMAGPDFDDGYAFLHVRGEPSLALGDYVECIGRSIISSDVGEQQNFSDVTVSAAKLATCNQSSKKCYYTKTATCTEVSPGVWVWIPGTITGQCLAAAPGTLDTWTNVMGRTYQIIRESVGCTGAAGDCTSYSPETPSAGEVSCP